MKTMTAKLAALWRQDGRPAHVIDAERNPGDYFRCAGCGSGPWHNSWAAIEVGRNPISGKVIRRMPKRPLGACCSGAD